MTTWCLVICIKYIKEVIYLRLFLADNTSKEFVENDGVDEYQNVMSKFKRKSSSKDNVGNCIQKSAPALLNSDEVVLDDWLEDDLFNTKSVKKRKMDPIMSVFSSAGPSGAKNTLVSPKPRNSSSPKIKSQTSR